MQRAVVVSPTHPPTHPRSHQHATRASHESSSNAPTSPLPLRTHLPTAPHLARVPPAHTAVNSVLETWCARITAKITFRRQLEGVAERPTNTHPPNKPNKKKITPQTEFCHHETSGIRTSLKSSIFTILCTHSTLKSIKYRSLFHAVSRSRCRPRSCGGYVAAVALPAPGPLLPIYHCDWHGMLGRAALAPQHPRQRRLSVWGLKLELARPTHTREG
jgi:hypothetical protein